MRTVSIPAAGSAARHPWRAMVLALAMLAGALSTAALAQPPAAQAATMSVDQCNGHGPGAEGATTQLRCTVTVVNTINGRTTHSVTTVTRLCTLGPCSTPNGTSSSESTSLVTAVRQCNSSDNDAAHTIICDVTISNIISGDSPGAQSLTSPSVNQCVGSAGGGIGVLGCRPAQASTGAAVTQCNGSANGGGGTVRCSLGAGSRVSAALPITVNQCNGSGNPGGSSVTCRTSIMTSITGPVAPAAPVSAGATATRSAPARKTATPTKTTATATTTTTTAAITTSTTPGQPESARAAERQALAGAIPAAGPSRDGLLMLLAGLLLAGATAALLIRRLAPADSRYARRH